VRKIRLVAVSGTAEGEIQIHIVIVCSNAKLVKVGTDHNVLSSCVP
jgi:hypothetical protein